MEKITSRQNKTVREAAALLSSAEERAARGSSSVRGPACARTRPALA